MLGCQQCQHLLDLLRCGNHKQGARCQQVKYQINRKNCQLEFCTDDYCNPIVKSYRLQVIHQIVVFDVTCTSLSRHSQNYLLRIAKLTHELPKVPLLRAISTRKLWREGSKSFTWKSLRDGLLAMAAVEGSKGKDGVSLPLLLDQLQNQSNRTIIVTP